MDIIKSCFIPHFEIVCISDQAIEYGISSFHRYYASNSRDAENLQSLLEDNGFIVEVYMLEV